MALGCRSETMPFDYRMARTLKGEGHAVLDGLRVLHAIHAFREAAASFRPLTAAERGSFREFRLRLVAARGGETLAQLLTRANAATWSTEMVCSSAERHWSRRGYPRPCDADRRHVRNHAPRISPLIQNSHP